MEAILEPSKAKDKKYSIRIFNKKINFGDSNYEDYTQHKDDRRKQLYIQRHKKREDWNNPSTAGFWSRWLLWNKPTLQEAKRDILTKFHIKVLSV
jgi:Family of unknown function (DUF5754)